MKFVVRMLNFFSKRSREGSSLNSLAVNVQKRALCRYGHKICCFSCLLQMLATKHGYQLVRLKRRVLHQLTSGRRCMSTHDVSYCWASNSSIISWTLTMCFGGHVPRFSDPQKLYKVFRELRSHPSAVFFCGAIFWRPIFAVYECRHEPGIAHLTFMYSFYYLPRYGCLSDAHFCRRSQI